MAQDPVLPAAFAVRCPTALIYDHEAAVCHLVCETPDCVNREQILTDIDAIDRNRAVATARVLSVTEEDPVTFTDAVLRAKEYISAGDVYQANLSRQWSAEVAPDIDASDIYAALV